MLLSNLLDAQYICIFIRHSMTAKKKNKNSSLRQRKPEVSSRAAQLAQLYSG